MYVSEGRPSHLQPFLYRSLAFLQEAPFEDSSISLSLSLTSEERESCEVVAPMISRSSVCVIAVSSDYSGPPLGLINHNPRRKSDNDSEKATLSFGEGISK